MAKKKTISKDMVQLALDSHKWINTPVVYTTLGSNFTLLQQDVMLMVSGKLQEYIKQYLRDERYRDPKNPKPIFTPEQIASGIGDIRIQLSDLKVGNSHYANVDNALEALRQLWVKAPVFDKQTGRRVGDDWYPVFEKVFIPASNTNADGEQLRYSNKEPVRELSRKEGYIDVTINHQVAAYVFDMSHGYFNHLERIALFCRSAYTSRVYMMLMRYVSRGQMSPVVPFEEIKDFLGMIERDRKTNEIKSVRYEKFSQFRKQVLDVAKKDMLRLSDDLKTEIVFDYEPLYKGTTKRGNPTAIKFTIKRTDLGVAREVRVHRQTSEKKVITKLTTDYPSLSKDSLEILLHTVDDEHWSDFKQYVQKTLSKEIEKPHRWGGTPEGYVVHLLHGHIATYKPKPLDYKDIWRDCMVDIKANFHLADDDVWFESYDKDTGALLLDVRDFFVQNTLESDDNLPLFRKILLDYFGSVKKLNYRHVETKKKT